MHSKVVWGGRHARSAYFMKDRWGPYDFYRQFNITIPEQVKLDCSPWLGPGYRAASRIAAEQASRIGIRALYGSFDENSRAEKEYPGSDCIFSVNLYFT